MNYPPNYIHWHIGSVVIHDADAKKPRMLMRVVARLGGDQIQTEYIDPKLAHKCGRGRGSRLVNSYRVLHDSRLWALPIRPDPTSADYDQHHDRVDGLKSENADAKGTNGHNNTSDARSTRATAAERSTVRITNPSALPAITEQNEQRSPAP